MKNTCQNATVSSTGTMATGVENIARIAAVGTVSMPATAPDRQP